MADHSTISTTARLSLRMALAAGCEGEAALKATVRTVAQIYDLSPVEAFVAVKTTFMKPTTTTNQ